MTRAFPAVSSRSAARSPNSARTANDSALRRIPRVGASAALRVLLGRTSLTQREEACQDRAGSTGYGAVLGLRAGAGVRATYARCWARDPRPPVRLPRESPCTHTTPTP